LKAKKALGQHFLIDENLSSSIADALTQIEQYPRILEIGPGKGVLTKYLLNKSAEFQAVELDRDMVSYLTKHYPGIEDKLINIDFLKVDFDKVYDGQEFLLIGNYPYNISTEIIFKMLGKVKLIPEMVGMFQKEVADRIVAPHGSKTYGVTSVLTQAFYTGETLFAVPPQSFNPPPKVNSSVIRLVRKEGEMGCDPKKLRQIVKMTFNQRRKMLRNTLKSIVEDHSLFEDKFFTLRPEQLSVQDFIELTNLIENKNES
jgi:16S rRNA (adenine1518-N6/adenine1519-N6)-dimethyltransferase